LAVFPPILLRHFYQKQYVLAYAFEKIIEEVPHIMTLNQRFNQKTIIQNIAALFSGSMIAQGMTAMALLLTARQLGSVVYGQYASCYILASFTSIVFSLGLDIWLLREGGRNSARLSEVVGSVLAIKFVLGLVWLAAMLALSPLLNSATFPKNILALTVVSVWLDTLFSTHLAAFKASLRNQFTMGLEGGVDTAWFIVTIVLIAAGERQPTNFILARIAAQALFLVIALVLVARVIRLQPTFSTVRWAMCETLPYAASELLASTLMRADVMIVAFLLTETEVGQYSPAVGIVNAAFLVPAAVYMVITPVLSNLFLTDMRQGWLTAKRSLLLLVVMGVAITVAMYLLAGPATTLLGQSFSGSRQVLQILSIILFVHSLSFGLAAIIIAANLQARRTVVQVVAVLVNILLNLLVVPRAGITGAAGVYVITELVLFSGYGLLVFKYWRQTTIERRIAPIQLDD
jgi:O-antigen/teichoic acid export membrane protein